jgi:hypothetical protein
MKTTWTLAAVLALATASQGAVVALNQNPGSDTDNPLVYEVDVPDAVLGETSTLEVIVTPLAPFGNWVFVQGGLSYNDGSGRWGNWIDDKSASVLDGENEIEGVTFTFRRKGETDLVSVDLGAGGLAMDWNQGGLLANGVEATEDGGDTSVLNGQTNVAQIAVQARPGVLNDDAFDLETLDIAQIVPEPATMAVLGLGGLAILRRRRR